MIRLLKSGNLKDIMAEIALLKDTNDAADLPDKITTGLTFKFSEYSIDMIDFLEKQAGIELFPFWRGDGERRSQIIISFPSWNSVEKIRNGNQTHHQALFLDIRKIKTNYRKKRWEFTLPGKTLEINRPLVMGILNVTPDSFSDGNQFLRPEKAVARAMEMIENGADIIDIGGESTRPGAEPVSIEDECSRVLPVLKRLRKVSSVPVSIDTYKAETAHRAIQEGADIVNDISGLTFDPHMADVVAQKGVPLILMHIKGIPGTMQNHPFYNNLMEEVLLFLSRQIEYAKSRGINQLIVDPGIGFGKRYEDNFEIIRRIGELKSLGWPVLLGPSRKKFIGRLLNREPDARLMGTAAAVAIGISNGANIFRVHDVREIAQVVHTVEAIQSFGAHSFFSNSVALNSDNGS